MTEEKSEKLTMKSAMLDDRQKVLVIQHLFIALRQTFVKMHELNGSRAVFDLQQHLISGVKSSDTTGFPLDQEKAVIDTVVTLLTGVVSFK